MMRIAVRAAAMGLIIMICGLAAAQPRLSTGQAMVTRHSHGFTGGDPIGRFRQDVTAAQSATADHPLFQTSYMGEEDRIVAQTAFGPVTSRDLYLWLLLREGRTSPFVLELYEKARTSAEQRKLAKQIREEIADFVFVNYVMPGLRPDEPCDAESALKSYLLSLPGYQLTYIKRIIEPQLCILPGDRIKFLREHAGQIVEQERWRVSYIFRESDEDDPIELQDEIESELYAIRERILAGELTFAEAAREYSEAPSAPRGGEIPPFRRGELFFLMEETAAALQPGEISEVFRGPGGLYMVQLIEVVPAEEPSITDPEQARVVDEALSRQVLRAQYNWDVKDLFTKRRLVLYNNVWDDRQDYEPVGIVRDFEITKLQFRTIFPAIEADNLAKRDVLIRTRLRAILEREAIAQEVREAGCENDPIIARSKEIALNLVRYDNFIECLYRDLKLDEEVVYRFWRENPALFTPMAMRRVIKVTLQPVDFGPHPEEVQSELERVMAQLAEGSVPSPTPLPAEEEALEFIEDEFVEEIIELQGGAAPETAAGGSSPFGPGLLGGPRRDPEAERTKIKNYSDVPIRPAFAAEEQPALLIEDERAPQMPPLPLDYFTRIEPSFLRDLIVRYQSSSFVLRFEDLGFIYIEDHLQIPRQVQRLPLGSYSRPVLKGAAAESYYVEDERRLPKPPFEAIKTQVYTSYRQVEMEKRLQNTYNAEIGKASIKFTF